MLAELLFISSRFTTYASLAILHHFDHSLQASISIEASQPALLWYVRTLPLPVAAYVPGLCTLNNQFEFRTLRP